MCRVPDLHDVEVNCDSQTGKIIIRVGNDAPIATEEVVEYLGSTPDLKGRTRDRIWKALPAGDSSTCQVIFHGGMWPEHAHLDIVDALSLLGAHKKEAVPVCV